jgi:membrane protein
LAGIGQLKERAAARLAAARRRWPWLDVTIRGYKRFQATEASVSAVQVAYTAFFSIFPLLFVAVGVLGIVLNGNPSLQASILASVKANFPGDLSGLVAANLDRAQSGAAASIGVGLVLLLYSGTGAVVAVERGLSRAFGRTKAGSNLLTQRGRALGWLVTVGLLLALSVVLGGAVGGAGQALLRWLGLSGALAGLAVGALVLLVGLALDTVLFVVTFWLLPHQGPSPRQALRGAFGAAVWWGLLKTLGAFYVQRSVRGAQNVFGPLAVVVGLLVFVNLAAQLLLLTASIMAEDLGFPLVASRTSDEEAEETAAPAEPAPAAAAPAPRARRPVGPVALGVMAGWLLGRRRGSLRSPGGRR